MKKLFNVIASLIITIFLSVSVFAQEAPEYVEPEIDFASGKVLEIIKEEQNQDLASAFQTSQLIQLAKVIVINGKHKGKIVEIENQLTSNPAYDIKLRPGMRVVLTMEKTPGQTQFYITDIERFPILMIILGLFLVLLLAIGGKKGLRSLISLGVTTFLIFFVLVPAILNSYPIIPSAIGVSLISTIMTMTIVGGWNLKSLSASLGTIISVTIAGLVSLLVIHSAPLSGFHDQESSMLWMARPDLDFTEILAASVIIAALGAVMDVGMSIASSINEIKNANKDLTPVELIKSGMNVGRDIMGTMSDTLIMAYIGGAFSLMLLAANAPFIKLINLNSIATEITAAITGSIGIVLCVPITAAIAGWLIGRKQLK
ncbi:MAG: hypothetical protein A2Y25_09360 [Candidatus Melainabacteria bacterium GWF2_37_15]|nr:MAG: hypothetical protein A2Y25_09360 [Candidatus Melainabacteria bacterium GWF2_37_15]